MHLCTNIAYIICIVIINADQNDHPAVLCRAAERNYKLLIGNDSMQLEHMCTIVQSPRWVSWLN
jgi:hypothetical protein